MPHSFMLARVMKLATSACFWQFLEAVVLQVCRQDSQLHMKNTRLMVLLSNHRPQAPNPGAAGQSLAEQAGDMRLVLQLGSRKDT